MGRNAHIRVDLEDISCDSKGIFLAFPRGSLYRKGLCSETKTLVVSHGVYYCDRHPPLKIPRVLSSSIAMS